MELTSMKRDQATKTSRLANLAASTLIACCLSMCCVGQTAAHSTIAAAQSKANPEAHAMKRAVTVADSIPTTRFGDPFYADGGSANGIVGKFSPNGEQFVVLLKKGNLQDNTNEYSLVLFKTAEAFHSPAPRTLVSMSSSSNRPAIQNVAWLKDNDTVLFLGERPGETSQLYSFQCSSGKLTRLTNRDTNLTLFVTALGGDEIAYVVESQASSFINDTV